MEIAIASISVDSYSMYCRQFELCSVLLFVLFLACREPSN